MRGISRSPAFKPGSDAPNIVGSTVSVPASFPHTPAFTITRLGGGKFSHNLNPDDAAYKPTPTVTYYVDKNRPNNSADGLTPATALRDISAAVVKVDWDQIIIEDHGLAQDFYIGTNAWNSATCARGGIIRSSNGGRIGIVQSGSGVPPVWEQWTPKIYRTLSAAGNFSSVVDLKYKDRDGFFFRYTQKSDVNDLQPGEYATGGGWVYARAPDDRPLIGDTQTWGTNQNNNGRWSPTASAMKLWMKGIDFIGGARPLYALVGAGITPTCYLEDCTFQLASTASGLNVESPGGLFVINKCKSGFNYLDGNNIHGVPAGTPTSPSPVVYSLDCVMGYNGYNLGATSENDHTFHEETCGVTLNPDIRGSKNRTVHHIDNAEDWILGGRIGRSRSNVPNTSSTVEAGGSGRIWLDEVTLEANPNVPADIFGTINYHSTELSHMRRGTGTFTEY